MFYFSDLRQSTFWVEMNDAHDNKTLYWLNGEQADSLKGRPFCNTLQEHQTIPTNAILNKDSDMIL